MYKTTDRAIKNEERIMVDTKTLAGMLGCGITTALKLGTDAKAKVKVGKRVLWNVKKVSFYLDAISTD